MVAILAALTAPGVYAQPKIQVVEGTDIRLDTTEPGIIFKAITVKNAGTSPLHISEVRTSCGCTTVPLRKALLGPGDTSILHVRMDLHDKVGEQHKDIYFLSDDPMDSLLQVSFRTFLSRDIEVKPMMFPATLATELEKTFKSSVQLRNISSDTIELGIPLLQSDAMTAEFNHIEGLRLAPRDSVLLTASVVPHISGYWMGKVRIPSTNGKRNSEITVDVACLVPENQKTKSIIDNSKEKP
jgi:hypothetical protein